MSLFCFRRKKSFKDHQSVSDTQKMSHIKDSTTASPVLFEDPTTPSASEKKTNLALSLAKSRMSEDHCALACKKISGTVVDENELRAFPPVKFEATMVPSTSRIKMNPGPDVSSIQWRTLVDELVKEIYILAGKKIGGTILVYHLLYDTPNWQATMQTFVSSKDYGRQYQYGILKKIFTSKDPEHDGAVILQLHDGILKWVSAKLPLTKHKCNQCKNRGTRHSSACSFSNSAPAPIIVMSEEKGQVSLFWKGSAQLDIQKENLKKDLINAYLAQEDCCPAYTCFDVHHFTTYYSTLPTLPMDDDCKWYFDCYEQNHLDLHKGLSFDIGFGEITATPENQEDYAFVQGYVKVNANVDLQLYKENGGQCLILLHGDKRLGGFFYKIVDRMLCLSHPFMLRQLLHDNFAVRFLEEYFFKWLYPNQIDKIAFSVPPHLIQPFSNFAKALNAMNGPSLTTNIMIEYSTDM